MKTTKKILLGIGALVAPISIMAVASCGTTNAPTDKSEINKEAAKVKFEFDGAATTLASTINKDTKFKESGFDSSKYQVEVKSVSESTDTKSVTVTFVLKLKNSTEVSDEKTFTISGFKVKPVEPKDKDKVKNSLNEIKTYFTDKLKNPTFSKVATVTNSENLVSTIVAELAKSNPSVSFNSKTRELKIGSETITFEQPFFESIKGGLQYLFRINGGSIKSLEDVFHSKANSIDTLLKDKAVLKLVEFLKTIGTFEPNWENDLKTAFDKQKDIEIQLNFDKYELLVKTAENKFTKIITFKKEFIDGFKEVIKDIANNLVTKFIGESDKSKITSVFLNQIVDSILKGVINIKNVNGSLQLSRPTTA